VHDQASVKGHRAGPLFTEGFVEGFGLGDFLAAGLGANRHVAHHLATSNHGGGVGAHPVVIAIFAAVFDQSRPRHAGLERGPHVGKGLHRHVWVADHVVRLAQQFVALETAQPDESLVGIGDAALRVCAGHQGGIGGEVVLALSHWQVLAHSDLVQVGVW